MKIIGEGLFSLVASCSAADLPVDVIVGIVKTESNGYVYALSGSYDYSHYYLLPKTEDEIEYAVNVGQASLEHDVNISIGLMQINSWHLKRMGSSVKTAFDACNNVLMGTSIFKEIVLRVCGQRINEPCLDSALRQYNTGRTEPSTAGAAYVVKVRANMPMSPSRTITKGWQASAF